MSLIRRIDLRDADRASVDYRASVPRAEFDVEAATHQVQPIIDAVRARGVEAIAEFSARFDGVETEDITVPREAIRAALDELDPGVRAALEESIRRLRMTSRGRARARRDQRGRTGRDRDPPQGGRSTASASTSPAGSRRW